MENFCPEHTQMREDIGSIKEGVANLECAIGRLDKRINGTFDTIGVHIKEAPEYRSRIATLEIIVKNIVEERNNSIKASQWRIALITATTVSILNILVTLFLKYHTH